MFVLPFEISQAPFSLSIRDHVILMGSCFSENIGAKLTGHKFRALINPFGVIYNPISIFKTLQQSVNPQPQEDRIVEADQIYHHWDTHSDLSDPSRETLILKLKKQRELTRTILSQASTLVLSPGTSWVYRHHSDHSIVANCHKVPQKEFTKSLLTVDQITQSYSETISLVRSLNPQLNVVVTISPVRHVRDGLIENNQSKAILIEAVRQIIANDTKASYFPSYEILIDVLRDYRFYKEDMIHPNDQAIDYIWEKFGQSYFDRETQNFIKEWGKLAKSMNHRPFHPETAAHQSFLKSTAKKLQSLADVVDIEEELKAIKKQLLDS
tara:strand:- start:240616 stop:241590 length:975 start_codon:yes stop_codon:yes gene_type:complete